MLVTPTPIGDLRYKMTILKVGLGQTNELGETVPTLNAVGTIWCKLTPISGTQKYINAQNTSDVTHEIRCRYTSNLNYQNKLQWGNNTYDLVSVLDVESQHIELVILAHLQVGEVS